MIRALARLKAKHLGAAYRRWHHVHRGQKSIALNRYKAAQLLIHHKQGSAWRKWSSITQGKKHRYTAQQRTAIRHFLTGTLGGSYLLWREERRCKLHELESTTRGRMWWIWTSLVSSLQLWRLECGARQSKTMARLRYGANLFMRRHFAAAWYFWHSLGKQSASTERNAKRALKRIIAGRLSICVLHWQYKAAAKRTERRSILGALARLANILLTRSWTTWREEAQHTLWQKERIRGCLSRMSHRESVAAFNSLIEHAALQAKAKAILTRLMHRKLWASLVSWRSDAATKGAKDRRMWEVLMTMVGMTMTGAMRFWRTIGPTRRRRMHRWRYLPLHVRIRLKIAVLERGWRQWLYGLAVDEVQQDSRQLAKQGIHDPFEFTKKMSHRLHDGRYDYQQVRRKVLLPLMWLDEQEVEEAKAVPRQGSRQGIGKFGESTLGNTRSPLRGTGRHPEGLLYGPGLLKGLREERTSVPYH